MKVSFKFDDNVGFVSDDNKYEIKFKNSIVNNDNYHSPTELLLMAMGGCTSDDVLNILKKMKEDVKSYRCEITGEKMETDPKILKFAEIHYIIEGNVNPESVKKAINLSLEKYCSVSITVKRSGVPVSSYFTINGKDFH